MEKVEMMQRSFENYLRVKQGKITVDITLGRWKEDRGNQKNLRVKKGESALSFFSAKMQAYGIGFPENGRCFSR